MTEAERKHCGCLADEACAICYFVEDVSSVRMRERAEIIELVRNAELASTPEYVHRRMGGSILQAETVADAMAQVLRSVREAIERGDHVK